MPDLRSGNQTNSILKMSKKNEKDLGDIPKSLPSDQNSHAGNVQPKQLEYHSPEATLPDKADVDILKTEITALKAEIARYRRVTNSRLSTLIRVATCNDKLRSLERYVEEQNTLIYRCFDDVETRLASFEAKFYFDPE